MAGTIHDDSMTGGETAVAFDIGGASARPGARPAGSSGYPGRVTEALERCAIALACLVAIFGCETDPGVQVIERAEVVDAARGEPPGADEVGLRSVRLPDFWPLERRRRSTEGWYRARFDFPEGAAVPWVLHLPRVSLNAVIFVNGVRIGDGGRSTPPVARNWNRPLLFEIPATALHPGENLVQIRLLTILTSLGTLGPIEVGPASVVRPRHEARYLLQIATPSALAAIMSGVALLLLTTYLAGRDEPVYLWYSLGALLWAINMADFYVRDIPTSTRVWQWAIHTGLLGACVCFALAVRRGLALPRIRSERVLLGLWGLVSLGLAIIPDTHFARLSALSAFAGLVLMLVASARLVRASLRSGTRLRASLLAAGAVAFAALAHDLALMLGAGRVVPLGDHLWHTYLVPIVVLLAGGTLARRYALLLRASRAANVDLEARVAEKAREIELQQVEVRRLVAERAVAGERDRLMREMHDGVAGQLAATVALAESEGASLRAVGEGLRDVLDDVRMMLDSLDPPEDLGTFLGFARRRLERTPTRHGLRFEWDVGDLPGALRIRPETALEILRILQEAIANAVRHAGATRIQVGTRTVSDAAGATRVCVEVADDGRGLARDRVLAGRGLTNMRKRAESIGGSLEIGDGLSRETALLADPGHPIRATGTAVRLWLAAGEASIGPDDPSPR